MGSRKIWICAALLGISALPGLASTFYVRSIATVTTSGNILDGHFNTQDTGQVSVLTNSAGPFDITSQGSFYSFEAAAQAVTELGVQHAFAEAFATSTGPAGGANASAQSQWSDTITITSPTLAPGTLVSFLATITLDRIITGTSGPGVHGSAEVTGPFGMDLLDSLSSPNSTHSVSKIVTTTIGSVLTATSTLTLEADAGGIAPFLGLSASVHAEHTSTFHLDPITPGASYSTASGAAFLSTPEPASMFGALSGLALIATIAARRARVRA